MGLTGVATTSVPAGAELQDNSGLKYRTDTATSIGAGGTVNIAVTAELVGEDHNQDSGVILTFVSPIANVDTDATVTSNGITGGLDAEDDDTYRARLLIRKRFPPHGGIAHDYEIWALEVTGVTRAWAIKEYQGIGTIGLIFVLDGATDIFPDETKRNEVRDYIISHTDLVLGKTVGAPVTAEPGFFTPESFAKTINFDLDIFPNTSDIQAAILTKLNDLILIRGGAEQTITISQMYEAITTATGEVKTRINSPVTDQAAAVNEVHVLGDVTFGEY